MLCVGSERRDERTRFTKKGSARGVHNTPLHLRANRGRRASLLKDFWKGLVLQFVDRRNESRGDEMAIDVDFTLQKLPLTLVDQLIAPIDDPLEYGGPCILSSQLSEEHNDQFPSEAQENEEEAEVYAATTAGHRVKRQRVQKLPKSISYYDEENLFLLQNAGQRRQRFPKIKTNEKFRCEVCGRCFHSNTNLLVHYAVHTGEKPYKCSFCEKGFSQKGNLQAHERIHRGEKPFSCVICGRSFTQKVCLRNHERIHRGEKPFTCMTCGKGFTQKVTLQQHLAVHDKTTKRVRRKPRKNHCDLDFSFM
ncbi:zinc finger protein 665 [Danio aesculapii]|uniref:zinc finger protein 665 n=1 Tax=Danio aesculapii TaxID=1142201 RepID=UPI0024BFAD16|nr:zinc finger protein 665 [Danio aesculapii]